MDVSALAMEKIIIDDGRSQPRGQRAAFRLLTALFWGLFLYFLHPLLELLPRAFGIDVIPGLALTGGDHAFLPMILFSYLLFLAGLALLLEAWILYNILRNRRRRMVPAGSRPGGLTRSSATIQGLDEKTLEDLRKGRVVRLHHDREGRILRIQDLDPCA